MGVEHSAARPVERHQDDFGLQISEAKFAKYCQAMEADQGAKMLYLRRALDHFLASTRTETPLKDPFIEEETDYVNYELQFEGCNGISSLLQDAKGPLFDLHTYIDEVGGERSLLVSHLTVLAALSSYLHRATAEQAIDGTPTGAHPLPFNVAGVYQFFDAFRAISADTAERFISNIALLSLLYRFDPDRLLNFLTNVLETQGHLGFIMPILATAGVEGLSDIWAIFKTVQLAHERPKKNVALSDTVDLFCIRTLVASIRQHHPGRRSLAAFRHAFEVMLERFEFVPGAAAFSTRSFAVAEDDTYAGLLELGPVLSIAGPVVIRKVQFHGRPYLLKTAYWRQPGGLGTRPSRSSVATLDPLLRVVDLASGQAASVNPPTGYSAKAATEFWRFVKAQLREAVVGGGLVGPRADAAAAVHVFVSYSSFPPLPPEGVDGIANGLSFRTVNVVFEEFGDQWDVREGLVSDPVATASVLAACVGQVLAAVTVRKAMFPRAAAPEFLMRPDSVTLRRRHRRHHGWPHSVVVWPYGPPEPAAANGRTNQRAGPLTPVQYAGHVALRWLRCTADQLEAFLVSATANDNERSRNAGPSAANDSAPLGLLPLDLVQFIHRLLRDGGPTPFVALCNAEEMRARLEEDALSAASMARAGSSGGKTRRALRIAVHTGVVCNGCGACPITGVRYRCMTCEKWNWCSSCHEELRGKHPTSHEFEAHTTPLDVVHPKVVQESLLMVEVAENYNLFGLIDQLMLEELDRRECDVEYGTLKLTELYATVITASQQSGPLRTMLLHLQGMLSKSLHRQHIISDTSLVKSLSAMLQSSVHDSRVKITAVWLLLEMAKLGIHSWPAKFVEAKLYNALLFAYTQTKNELLQDLINELLVRCMWLDAIPQQHYIECMRQRLWDMALSHCSLQDRLLGLRLLWTSLYTYPQQDVEHFEANIGKLYNAYTHLLIAMQKLTAFMEAACLSENGRKYLTESKGNIIDDIKSLGESERFEILEHLDDYYRMVISESTLLYSLYARLAQFVGLTEKLLRYFLNGSIGMVCHLCGRSITNSCFQCDACRILLFCSECATTGHHDVTLPYYIVAYDSKPTHTSAIAGVPPHPAPRGVHSAAAHRRFLRKTGALVGSGEGARRVVNAAKAAVPDVTLAPQFLEGRAVFKLCPNCSEAKGAYVDGCNMAVCLGCCYTYCTQCFGPFFTEDERTPSYREHLQKVATEVIPTTRSKLFTFLKVNSQVLSVSQNLSTTSSPLPTAAAASATVPPLLAPNTATAVCTHCLFSTDSILQRPPRCALCHETLHAPSVASEAAVSTTDGCDHRACQNCVVYYYHRAIARNEIIFPASTADGPLNSADNGRRSSRGAAAAQDAAMAVEVAPTWPGIRCPVPTCNSLCGERDPHDLKKRVDVKFYELFKDLCSTHVMLENARLLGKSGEAEHLRYIRCPECHLFRLHTKGRIIDCFHCGFRVVGHTAHSHVPTARDGVLGVAVFAESLEKLDKKRDWWSTAATKSYTVCVRNGDVEYYSLHGGKQHNVLKGKFGLDGVVLYKRQTETHPHVQAYIILVVPAANHRYGTRHHYHHSTVYLLHARTPVERDAWADTLSDWIAVLQRQLLFYDDQV